MLQKVIDELAMDKTITLFLFGGGQREIDKLNSLKQDHQNVTVVAGKLKLQQELALISHLDLDAEHQIPEMPILQPCWA